MAFNWEHAGSSLAVLPLDDCGRKSKNMPLLHGHTDTVTDLHFSPFHDGLLATGSQDCLVNNSFLNTNTFLQYKTAIDLTIHYSGEDLANPREGLGAAADHTRMSVYTQAATC